MGGRGAWRDNVFVEHLWRSVKYEDVYFCADASVADARAEVARYFRLQQPTPTFESSWADTGSRVFSGTAATPSGLIQKRERSTNQWGRGVQSNGATSSRAKVCLVEHSNGDGGVYLKPPSSLPALVPFQSPPRTGNSPSHRDFPADHLGQLMLFSHWHRKRFSILCSRDIRTVTGSLPTRW